MKNSLKYTMVPPYIVSLDSLVLSGGVAPSLVA